MTPIGDSYGDLPAGTPTRRRVLLLARTLGLGGMERMTVNLANALLRQGHEVHLMVFKNRIDLRPDPGVRVHVVDLERMFRLTVIGGVFAGATQLYSRLFARDARNVLHSLHFSRLFRLWLWRLERRFGRMDMIVARGYGTFQGLSGIRDPRLIRVIVNEQWETPRSRWHRRYYRGSFAGAKVVFNSSQIEAKFRALCREMGVEPAQTRVIDNPTDVEAIRRGADTPPPVTGPYIVSVGRLERAKNHQLLISAFAKLKDRIPHRLVLVGKGNLLPALEQQAAMLGVADRVIFAGQQLNPYPWIRHAALFVLPSLHEGLPNVVIEALVCGTPVVVTRGDGGTVELMRGELERFIAEMDPDSLADKMDLALQNPPRIEPATTERFSMDSVAREYLRLVGTD